ncbi:MAG TPA: DUF4097 family beta strand repeat-containing protein [Acidobacteriota bacterium]|nr:DUF4097 family beta strand repeat-containing protein [Acidobacteriota bacterium]
MSRICMTALAFLFSFQLVQGKDFQKSYTLAPGGQIFIDNFLGDVTIRGFKGDSIEISANKKGEDRDKIEILDSSLPYRIDIRLRPPLVPVKDARVDFEVRVPESVEYNFARISSFGGNVDISSVVGQLNAESVRGNVALKDVRGLVNASSFSGNIRVDIGKAQERSNMRFSSISGNIDVSAPANLDAVVDISCSSGLLRTDFPLEVQEWRYGPARSARGRLGGGMQTLRIRSVSGRVNLTKN